MRLKKLELSEIPFEECNELSILEQEEWTRKNLQGFSDWLLPQIVAHFGRYKAEKRPDGKYCPLSTLKTNVGTDSFELGLWKVCTRVNRSQLIRSQKDHPEYSALVPLILSGFKKHQNIAYNSWSVEGLEHIVGTKLYELMTFEPPVLSKDELLKLRDEGLLIRSGPNSGKYKVAESTWKLSNFSKIYSGCPDLYSAVACQLWVAHPSLRNQYMILDCQDWDRMPEPLISVDVLEPEVPVASKKHKKVVVDDNEIPWL